VIENGRRYANTTYPIPNDAQEETRLAITHQAYLNLLSGDLTYCHVPEDIRRILDIGSGPGDWAISMAMKYPRADVIATDISAYPSAALPPNVTMVVDDATDEWTFEDAFDLIHLRDMCGAFSDWNHVLRQVHANLKLHGRVELCEHGLVQLRTYNGHHGTTSATERYFTHLEEASRLANIPPWNTPFDRSTLSAAGLSRVKRRRFRIDMTVQSDNPDKEVLGKMSLVAALESVEARALRLFTSTLKWQLKQAQELFEQVKEEWMDPTNGAYTEVEFVMAIKRPI